MVHVCFLIQNCPRQDAEDTLVMNKTKILTLGGLTISKRVNEEYSKYTKNYFRKIE